MIPRYQRILFWSLAGGILLMAAFLLRGCEQAHNRLAAPNDATPLAAPTSAGSAASAAATASASAAAARSATASAATSSATASAATSSATASAAPSTPTCAHRGRGRERKSGDEHSA